MNVKIVGMSQDLSFADGTYSTFLRIQLPNGQEMKTAVDEENAMRVTACFQQHAAGAFSKAASVSAPMPSAVSSLNVPARDYSPMSLDNDAPDEFGGVYEGPPEQRSTQEWVAQESPPVVSADAHGYPVAQGEGIVDTAELAGGYNASEEDDGVGSV